MVRPDKKLQNLQKLNICGGNLVKIITIAKKKSGGWVMGGQKPV